MPRVAKGVTIYQLSKQLGIAPSTVSKALNHSPEISVELRARVQDVARANSFQLRNVRQRITNICVVIQQIAGHALDFSPYMARVLEGVAQYTREAELEMSIYAGDVDELNKQDLVRELKKRGATGAVILRANRRSRFYEQMEQQHFPYVSVVSHDGTHTRHCIGQNEIEAVDLVVSHLLDLGHRRLALLNHVPQNNSGMQRIEDVKKRLLQANVDLEPVVLIPEPQQNGLQFGRDSVAAIRQSHPDVSAVMTFDHFVAIGVMRGAAIQKLRIPEDLSLCCFGEYPESEFLNPPVTTVGVPFEKIGYCAAREVHNQISNQNPFDFEQEVRLRPVLNIRESTCRARTSPSM